MNKKLLFAAMSLAALTACTDNDFESQKMAEEVSPVQFEVINNNVMTRASWNANADKVVWSANDGDLFTLYHGVAALGGDDELTGYQNATYKAAAAEGSPATLTTPSMILPGYAVMVWPVDTTFRATDPAAKLTVKIPAEQPADVENQIPYVSDLINIGNYAKWDESTPAQTLATTYNVAGKDRKYPVYMRPMASQLNLKAEYVGTDDIEALYEGKPGVAAGEGIAPITVSSMELITKAAGADLFTTEIPLKFTADAAADARWDAAVPENAWSHVTGFDVTNIAATAKTANLTTECLVPGNKGGKFLILPQAAIADGVDDAGIVVNTYYGKVVIQDPTVAGTETKYNATEYKDAWYRYVGTRVAAATTEENASATEAEPATSENAGKYKTIAISPALGMQQTINYMSTYVRNSATSVVNTEPIGVALTRYVKVYLTHLDMSGLHVKSDKQLRDVVRVWKALGLDKVTVYLDDDEEGEADFHISQKTIEVINSLNTDVDADNQPDFKVMPCQLAAPHKCNKIVITGGGDVQDIAFIAANGAFKADVELNAGETWKWNSTATRTGIVKVPAAGVNKIINKGTLVNAANATLKTTENNGTQNNILLQNDGTWDITAGTIFVQFSVTNNKVVNISNGAEYRVDGAATIFINDATTLEKRFLADPNTEAVGKVNNFGVFATVNGGTINNYGLIEHAHVDAKTYISSNENGGAGFGTAFGATNKIGRINLPYSNKLEDNISVNSALDKGFISVTVNGEVTGALDASVVGTKVNYVIVKSGITEISGMDANVKYLEINQSGTELAWNVAAATEYDGLIILSKVNIKQGTTIDVKKGNYLGADMYVGGTFKFNGGAVDANSFKSYYGDKSGNFATMYVTY